jgi:endonuclease/exonuclease/phosphatase family metal-dependent hydrolase
MKLISLNIWGGNVREPLLEFACNHAHIDVFCLQEVYNGAQVKMSTDDKEPCLDVFSRLLGQLPEHRGFFRAATQDNYGIAMLIKNDVEVLGEGEVTIHHNPNYPGRGPTHSRILQWLTCRSGEKVYSIANVHGLWNGQGKTDTPERIAQSKKIKDFLNTLDTPIVLCGDFNLRPDTESIKIVSVGMSNLIETYGIESTRTNLYDKDEKFADYVFTSPQIQVNRFEVMPDVVSDHAPLLLDFE